MTVESELGVEGAKGDATGCFDTDLSEGEGTGCTGRQLQAGIGTES